MSRNPKWSKLPIYLCGVGRGGELITITGLSKGEQLIKRRISQSLREGVVSKTVYDHHSRIKKIVTINTPYRGESSRLSIERVLLKYKSHIPLMMFYSSSFKGDMARVSDYCDVKRLYVQGMTCEKLWFPTLDSLFKLEMGKR